MPKLKIELTPAMIAAGAREFMACRSLRTEDEEQAAADIFRAMLAASLDTWVLWEDNLPEHLRS